MATEQDVQNLIGHYSNLRNQIEDYQTNGVKVPPQLLQQVNYIENAVKSTFDSNQLAWISQQVDGTRASMRETQNRRESARLQKLQDSITDSSFTKLTQNMNNGNGLSADQIAAIKVTGKYERGTGKESFDRQTLEDAMEHLTTPDGKQFAKDFDEYAEKMDGLVQRYREDPEKGIKALNAVGMGKIDAEEWEREGLKFELYNRWAEEDKDMDEYEEVEATEDEQRRADLICAMNDSERVWEKTGDQYDSNLQQEDSLHGDVARAMYNAEVASHLDEM